MMNGQLASSENGLLTSQPLRHPAYRPGIILGEPVSAHPPYPYHAPPTSTPILIDGERAHLSGLVEIERRQSPSPPPIVLPSPKPPNPNEPVSVVARKGREDYWKMVQSGEADTIPSNAATPTSKGGNGSAGSGINLVFRVPPGSMSHGVGMSGGMGHDGSLASGSGTTPGSSGKKRRRMIEVPPNPTRASRARYSTPSRSSTPQTSLPIAQPAIPPPAQGGAGALSIFAPPPDDSLPEALQTVIGSSSTSSQVPLALHTPDDHVTLGDKDKEGDAIMREAGEGFESRLRSARGNDPAVRTGVSASGKGVKVGGGAKEGGKVIKKKGKGKGDVEIPNHDFCSACRGIGKFLCCDGCPRSFHFMCLEPPLRVDELPEEETWYCKKCKAERTRETSLSTPSKEREIRPIPMVFKQLCKRVDDDNPASFKLPQDIRQFFQGISTDGRGNYVDAEETRTKYDRKGFQEERDGTRLRDAKSRPVSCYACGGSSIPLRSLTTDPESTWRQIVSCDHCALHWHLDCLSPPLASMPNSGRKWMCPNHAEQVMARRRTVRNNLEIVDIDQQGERNNGNIQVVPEEESRPKIQYEDLIINRKKYRVPEKIIRLDFWEKLGLGKGRKVPPSHGGTFRNRHSTLSLSSPESDDVKSEGGPEYSPQDMEAANLVLSLLHSNQSPSAPSASFLPPTATAASASESVSSRFPSVVNGQENSNNGSKASTPGATTSSRTTTTTIDDPARHGNQVNGADVSVSEGAERKRGDGPPRIMLRLSRH